jgi:hypothetical protein
MEDDIIIEQEDVKVIGGDFAIQSANLQNIKHIEIAEAGNYYISPTVGVAIYKQQSAPIVDFRTFTSKSNKELIKDGYSNINITGQYNSTTDNTELQITALRKKSPDRQTISEVEDLTPNSSDVVRDGQSLYDFAIWKYGTVEGIAKLSRDNGLKYDSAIEQGDVLIYSNRTGNQDVKDFFTRNNIIPISNIENQKVTLSLIFEDGNNFIFEDGNNFILE